MGGYNPQEGVDRAYERQLHESWYAEDAARIRGEQARSGGGGGGAVIGGGLLALGWAVQALRARFPLWMLLPMALAIAAACAWLVGRKMRSSDWPDWSSKVASAGVFIAISILLCAMFYDLNGLGTKVFAVYVGIFVVVLILGCAALLIKTILQHPIASIVLGGTGWFLIYGIFIAKPAPTAAPVAKQAEVRKAPVRKHVARKPKADAVTPPSDDSDKQ